MADELTFYDTNAAGTYQAYSQPPPQLTAPVVIGGDVNIVTTINGATGPITLSSTVGFAFSGSVGGNVVMSVSNPALARSSIGAAASGVNTDISQLNGASQVDVSGAYKVDGVQVLKEQQPAIANSVGTQPDDTRAINEILAMLRVMGIIAT